jgi:hypothetical protein
MEVVSEGTRFNSKPPSTPFADPERLARAFVFGGKRWGDRVGSTNPGQEPEGKWERAVAHDALQALRDLACIRFDLSSGSRACCIDSTADAVGTFVQVGRSGLQFGPGFPKRFTKALTEAEEAVEGLKAYFWPSRSASTQECSFRENLARVKAPIRLPTKEEAMNAIKRVSSALPVYKTSSLGFDEHDAFVPVTMEQLTQKVFPHIKKDSHPGVLFHALGCGNNAEVMDKYPVMLLEILNIRLAALSSVADPTKLSPLDWYALGASEIQRCFVKNEPHPWRKLGRERLIRGQCISLLAVEICLYGNMVSEELTRWETSPIKPGMGLNDSSLESLRDDFVRRSINAAKSGLKPFSTDVSGWDWNVRLWMTLLLAALLVTQLGVKCGTDRHRAINALEYALMHSYIMLADGTIWIVTACIGWTTGRFLTANGNSKMRILLAVLAGAGEAIAMGDDAVEWAKTLNLQAYAELGFRVEAADLPPGVMFEFCSMQFLSDGTYVFLNSTKALFRLLCQAPSLEFYCQFRYENRHAPELQEYVGVIERVWSTLWTACGGTEN